MPPSLQLLADVGITSIFSREAIFVVISLIVIEGLLSVDNALAIAAMAHHLPEKQRKLAITIGYAGAYGFRLIALLIADFIIRNHWLMILGAAYLFWLMCDHFAEESQEEAEGAKPDFVRQYSFGRTIALIALLDLSLSFDNVVAAVAFARDNIYLVYLGVTIGIITLRLVAGYCIRLLARFPWLEHTAYVLVGFVGALLCTELIWGLWIQREIHIGSFHVISGDSGHFHIAKVVKFVGLIGIIVVHIAYEHLPWLKRLMVPFLLPVRKVLIGIAEWIAMLISALFWPVKRLFRRSE